VNCSDPIPNDSNIDRFLHQYLSQPMEEVENTANVSNEPASGLREVRPSYRHVFHFALSLC